MIDTQMTGGDTLRIGADIGTGSGVLAIAMCLSGFLSCHAYEIDPVSINEAQKNIALNHLSDKIKVINGEMTAHKNRFSLICANLRTPTLSSLSEIIYTRLTKNGIAILSGVREWEKKQIIIHYQDNGFELAWQADEKKWSGFVWVKK